MRDRPRISTLRPARPAGQGAVDGSRPVGGPPARAGAGIRRIRWLRRIADLTPCVSRGIDLGESGQRSAVVMRSEGPEVLDAPRPSPTKQTRIGCGDAADSGAR